MKALLCTRYGGPDDLELRDLPAPVVGAGEAVVRVKAAALNFFDTLIIAGKYQVKPPLPFSPAAEFAGEVESVGAGVGAFVAGDRVMGSIGWGAAREQIVIAADRLTKLPAELDFDRAAGLTVTYGTSLHALKDRAALKSGDTLAVLGAAGGTGLSAVEIGRLMGARVIACASSEDKIAFARAHGADAGVNYASEDLKAALRDLTGGKGVDVVYDPIGGAQGEAAICAAWTGAGASWSSVLLPERCRSCRSISCFCAATTCSACTGVPGPSVTLLVSGPTWPNWCNGRRRENCRRTFTRSIHWSARRRRCMSSPPARPWVRSY